MNTDVLRIEGGVPLRGVAAVGGAKNAALPIMAAAILADGPVELERAPRLRDVETLGGVLRNLGVRSTRRGNVMRLETVDSSPTRADYRWVRRMRASFCVLGPLVARRGKAVVSLPGGCRIGPRPIDLHLAGIERLGADVRIQQGYVVARARRLRGADIDMRGPHGPTVTGTANIMAAATLARGVTTIRGAAREPELIDLGTFLNAMGARIEGLGTETIRIVGVDALGGAVHRVMPDRIQAATLLSAAAITRGDVRVTGANVEYLQCVLDQLELMGANVETGSDVVRVSAARRLTAADYTSRPFPGLPTDCQPQFMALASIAEGTSRTCEKVFPERFLHVPELVRLGARITRDGATATVRGVAGLTAAPVAANDLRGGAALVLASLAAEGETSLYCPFHLDRGYESLESTLRSLGARVERHRFRRSRRACSVSARVGVH